MFGVRKTKRFDYLKQTPKNGKDRQVFVNDILFSVLSKRLSDNGEYVFSRKGEPLSYRAIQNAYDTALKRCGLYPKFSGTHFLRHSMATLTRMVTGSLEATQSVAGHHDQKLVQHYASIDNTANQSAQVVVQNFLNKEQFLN